MIYFYRGRKGYKNPTYRGKNLASDWGGGLNDLIENIHQRIVDDFDDLYIGDYFDLPIVTEYAEETTRLRICDYNYLLNALDAKGNGSKITCNHIVLMPEKCLKTFHQINPTATTNGGFYGSNFCGKILFKYGTAFYNALNGHLIRYTSDLSSSLNTYNHDAISKILLPTQEQMLGVSTLNYSSSSNVLFNRQFEICRRDREFVTADTRYWLMNICDSQHFGIIGHTGMALPYPANDAETGIRPFICMC